MRACVRVLIFGRIRSKFGGNILQILKLHGLFNVWVNACGNSASIPLRIVRKWSPNVDKPLTPWRAGILKKYTTRTIVPPNNTLVHAHAKHCLADNTNITYYACISLSSWMVILLYRTYIHTYNRYCAYIYTGARIIHSLTVTRAGDIIM
jgi:hypothetical protein